MATVALLLAACGTDDSVVELGRIESYQRPPMIEAPSSAAVAEEFVVTVTTYGGGCIYFERTDVELTSEGADVFPLDRRTIPGEDGVCTADLRYYPHDATLAFATAGSKTIRIHGRRVDDQGDVPVEIPLTVVVE